MGGVSVDPAGTFASAIVTGPGITAPIPAIDMTPADPGFVGEFHSATSSPSVRLRDARLLPDSVLEDMGASPLWIDGACDAPFKATNGLLYTDVTRASALSSFDFDGDGHGNPRLVGEDIDIGFDEIDTCLLAGSYGNDTKSHHLPYDTTQGVDLFGVPRIPTGTPDRDYIFGTPSSFAFVAQIIDFPLARTLLGLPPGPEIVWTTTGSWTHMPGSVAFKTPEFAPGMPIGIPGIEFWLDMFGLFTFISPQIATNAGTFGTLPAGWTNPESGQVHAFHTFRWVLPETPGIWLPTYFTQQMFVLDPVLGFVSSNLLAEYL